VESRTSSAVLLSRDGPNNSDHGGGVLHGAAAGLKRCVGSNGRPSRLAIGKNLRRHTIQSVMEIVKDAKGNDEGRESVLSGGAVVEGRCRWQGSVKRCRLHADIIRGMRMTHQPPAGKQALSITGLSSLEEIHRCLSVKVWRGTAQRIKQPIKVQNLRYKAKLRYKARCKGQEELIRSGNQEYGGEKVDEMEDFQAGSTGRRGGGVPVSMPVGLEKLSWQPSSMGNSESNSREASKPNPRQSRSILYIPGISYLPMCMAAINLC